MANLSTWMHNIATNTVANVLVLAGGAALTGLALWLATLTPILHLFAPLSYLFAVLVALALASFIAHFGVRAWRHFRPFPPSDRPTNEIPNFDRAAPVDIGPIETALAGLQERHERLVIATATHAGEIVGVKARLGELEKLGPGDYLAYERWLEIAHRNIEQAIEQAITNLQRQMTEYQQPPKPPSRFGPPFFTAAGLSAQIDPTVSPLLGKTYEFSGKAVLDDNPHRSVPGDENIEDPARRHEYRKSYYDLQQVQSAREQIKTDIGLQKSKVYNAMVTRGRELEGKI